MTKPLDGKVALVTGASRGIGRAIAERLAADGARVAVHYGTRADAAAEVVAGIEAGGGSAFAIGQPLGVDGDVAGVFAGLDARAERLDILVNNAGVTAQVGMDATTPEAYDELFAVNARAPFFLTQEAARRMGAGGRIVTIGTHVTRAATPKILAYAMSKAAIDVMTLTLAKELAPRDITVNVVAPGITDTDMNAGWLRGNAEAAAGAAARSPFGRLATPADVAGVVAFAVSDDARFVTGQLLDASGGAAL